ncbi:MAG: MFS transporter [Clostridia bacterium]|nr:MFS transporter [Clostridia bacterium]
MKKLTKRWQIILYGCSGIGVNMLNIIVGSYLCSALLIGGFAQEYIGLWSYIDKDLVIAGMWAVLAASMKIFDGLIDLPLSAFTDNLKTRWGRRRPSILIGYIPTLIAFVLFLFPIDQGPTVANTIWFVALLGIFYGAYTLTMLTYYATFAEIVDNEKDRLMLGNTKSICDVVYFSLSFALVPVFVNMGMNIRIVALCFMPMALTMLIPLFMIKEPSTKTVVLDDQGKSSKKDNIFKSVGRVFVGFFKSFGGAFVGFFKSFGVTVGNKKFMYWLCILATMNVGLQLFLTGINEFFSTTGINMTIVMASAFAPIPLTLMLYNYIIKKKGFRVAYMTIVAIYGFGMGLMYLCRQVEDPWLTIIALCCGIIVSFSIGAFFSVTYTIPSQLAEEANKKGIACASSMYFAMQGLFEAISAAFAGSIILVFLKQNGLVQYMTLIISFFCLLAFIMSIFLPKSMAYLGKVKKNGNE